MGRSLVWAAALAAAVLSPQVAAAQAREVTGRVTRVVGGAPVPDATITEIGGRGVARTNPDGRFTINLNPGDTKILVRAIGYQRKEVSVGSGETTVTITLQEDPFKLTEVVTTGQTTTLERRNATTAVATVSAEEVTRAPAQALEQALQGKVLGATISMNSGAPGGGGQIQIRGTTSILGQGQPLFVVDGVIISNDATSSGANTITGAAARGAPGGIGSNQDAVVNRLADLNPNEIESVEILKSAAATAIYGSRATNGVVVIRTKRGAPGAPRFNVTGRVGTQQGQNIFDLRTFSSVSEVLASAGGAGADAVLNQLYPSGDIPASANRNYLREFYDNRDPSYELTANYSGGTATTQYFVSATNRQETGLAPRTGARLQAARVNIDQSFGTKFKVSGGLNITRNVLNRGLSNNDNTNTSPVYAFAYYPGVLNLDSIDANTGLYVRSPFNGGGNGVSNPFETFENITLEEDVFRQTGATTLTYTPVETEKNRVVFTALAGLDRLTQEGLAFSPGFLQFESPAAVDGFSGRVANTQFNVFNYNAQVNAAWTYNTGKVSFTTSAGTSYEQQRTDLTRTRARGIISGVGISQQGTQDQLNAITEFRDQAFFANEQILAFNDKLAVSGGFRADRSSANGDQTKFYFFPRASASYLIDNLGSTLQSVKIRGGIGETGNRPRYGDRNPLLTFGTIIGGQPTIGAPNVVGNPAIRPERLREWEAGADITFFNGRAQLEGTYFDRTLRDQLLQPSTAPSSGVAALVINGGQLQNRGVELGLNLIPVNSADFVWNSRTMFQRNTQRITNLPLDSVPRFPAPNSFGAAFGRNFITEGGITTWIWGNAPVVVQGGAPVAILPFGSTTTPPTLQPGQTVLPRDTIIGDANPDFQMFFNNSLTFKRLTLAFTVDWRRGGDVVNLTRVLFDEGQTSRDQTTAILPQDFPAGTIIPTSGSLGAGDFRYNNWAGGGDARAYIEDGSWVRVRDISLAYDAPTTWARGLGARSLRFNFQVRNPFLFSSYWGFDPEVNNFGAQNLNRFIDLAPFPTARQFFFSIDLGY